MQELGGFCLDCIMLRGTSVRSPSVLEACPISGERSQVLQHHTPENTRSTWKRRRDANNSLKRITRGAHAFDYRKLACNGVRLALTLHCLAPLVPLRVPLFSFVVLKGNHRANTVAIFVGCLKTDTLKLVCAQIGMTLMVYPLYPFKPT